MWGAHDRFAPVGALFGRERELSVARRRLDAALGGAGSVLLVSGEPGIGKSALARSIADAGCSAGMRVACGRAWEVGGAPAYWPWNQALSDIGLELGALLGDASGEMAQAHRLVAFDRVARALRKIASEQPLVLVLDDLHAADRASIELLVFLARTIASARVLVVVTTREVELTSKADVAELVGKIAREGEHLALRRLDEGALSEWLVSVGQAASVRDVLRVTDGNPLFVAEALRLGIAQFHRVSGGGVAAVIAEHLTRLPERTRAVLAAAAVIGRDAPMHEVARVVDAPLEEVEAHAHEAVRAGVLAPGDRVLFSHVLLRDALYASIEPSRRRTLHARVAEHAAAPELAAHHLLEARADAARVIPIVVAAADAAMRRHAVESALELVARARELVDDRSSLALDLIVAEADMRAGRVEDARARCVACADRAIELGDAAALARAALTYGLELISGRVDPVMIRLLERALALLGEEPSDTRARVLARLAAAKTPPRSDDEAAEAIAMARTAMTLARASRDPLTLLYCMRFAASAFGPAIDTPERHAFIEELMSLARQRNDELGMAQTWGFYCAHLAETGRLDEAEREVVAYAELMERLPLPAMKWRVYATRASLAAFKGSFAEARALGETMRRIAREHGAGPGLFAWALLQLSLASCQRDVSALAAVDTELLAIVSAVPNFAPWAAMIHALLGRREQARAALEPVLRFPRGFPWLIAGGEAATILGDPDIAKGLYEALLPERMRGRFFWGPAGVFPLGPTSRVLGELAHLAGRDDEARTHLDEAEAQCRSVGAVPLLELTLRARERLKTRPNPPSTALTLTREGDVWLVSSSDGARARIKHGKGLEYLEQLVANANRALHVLSLVGADDGDAGPMLDERAKASYRGRVSDLEDALAEAERNGDAGRAARARDELDALADELARAVGLGGRDRLAASNAERARINVQRRLKDVIKRIHAEEPRLARYLEATIRTGTYCGYFPV